MDNSLQASPTQSSPIQDQIENILESIDDPELEEPDSGNLLQLVKDEIVNQLSLPDNVSIALGPAFTQFQHALQQANHETGIGDLDQQVVLEIAKRFIWGQNQPDADQNAQGLLAMEQ